ncbi:hemin transporter [Streptomyces sp. TRM66268-LWL]|uniref:nitric oxide dioxygenase n=1 Tax=Streptomyces polyasparticus TaxID=2767826 RepID=A0ABR7SHD6_9ACTN|nr:globin domain-containing protein [Streptomyces polyasparticus]MBC9714012.1 hemin transporter [Streptomyces polyasparticus]
MLSEKSTEVVRATLPAVGAAIGDITPLFYEKMFAAHPELLRDLFNRGNQANGSQRQALAGSIATFATYLVEHPDTRPDVMLHRIAHKHASLGITAGQYEIVHRHLFEAIAEVLGEAVTPEVAAAWDEVYWLMANALIAIEARLYAEAGAPDGDSWRRYTVTGRVEETPEVTTFFVELDGEGQVPSAKPGQFVSVQVELPDGARQIRQYSLTNLHERGLQFAVKRIDGREGFPGEVSNHLHERAVVGTKLRISAPFGDVVLDEEARGPVLLASAGIGCTPMSGMLAALAGTGSERQVIVAHADRSERTDAFRSDLALWSEKLPNATTHVWYEQPAGPDHPAGRTGRMDLSGIELPEGVTAYLCGPLPFLKAVRTQLLEKGVPAARIRYEMFGPDLLLAN